MKKLLINMKARLLFIVCVLVITAHGVKAFETDVKGTKKATSKSSSYYLEMQDGIRLALDVWLPENARKQRNTPTFVEFTRYWRSIETTPATRSPSSSIQRALSHGYAYVVVDVRGSGASFGTRLSEFSLAEAQDFPAVIDWIAKQDWSNGHVFAIGTSYSGNTAETSALFKSPALTAAVPMFTDYDWYTSLVLPGGMKNKFIAEQWSAAVRLLDQNDPSIFGPHKGAISEKNPKTIGVMPVDGDSDKRLLVEATESHSNNRSLADNLTDLSFRDEYPSAATVHDAPERAISIHTFQNEFERQAVPMYHWGSWFDASTAAGVLARFTKFKAPYKYVIGAWSHGAKYDANPYNEKDAPVSPSQNQQFEMIIDFTNSFLKSNDTQPKKELLYFTVGRNEWQSTNVWPPKGHSTQRWWLETSQSLSMAQPKNTDGSDTYKVNFSVGTGSESRWATQIGGGDVWYGNRARTDDHLLVYTSPPLEKNLEITGTPIVSLQLESSYNDGALIVYLEDVDPNGYVRLLTEGALRLIHSVIDDKFDTVFGPVRSFEKAARNTVQPGIIQQIDMALLPISAEIKKGHSIRLSIAGHDKDTYVRVPNNTAPLLQLYRNKVYSSFIELPIITKSKIE